MKIAFCNDVEGFRRGAIVELTTEEAMRYVKNGDAVIPHVEHAIAPPSGERDGENETYSRRMGELGR